MKARRLRQRSYETREGEKRTVVELEVDEIGPSLRYATATITKQARTNDSGGGGDTGVAGSAASSAGGYEEEVPF